MIVPSAVDILRTIEHTMDRVVKPSVVGTTELSALATTSHLLRHAALRINNEGQVLLDDINALNVLLPSVKAYLISLNSRGANQQTRVISSAGLPDEWLRDVYPSLELMAREAGRLRQQLYEALEFLQGIRGEHRDDETYVKIRQEINAYVAAQIDGETSLIDPAFAGRGPRR